MATFCSTSKDGDAVRPQRTDQVEDRLDDLRREAERGLVEQQELRLGHERAGDGEHLLLAARQRAGELLAALGSTGKRPYMRS